MPSAIHVQETWELGGRTLTWGSRTYVMGILNLTPDSFSDGGLHATVETAWTHAQRMLDEGADVLDLGGESTRPGATPVSAEEELGRILPLIRRLASETDALLSVDTYKSEVAEAALSNGAHLINDIGGLQDAAMREVVARHGASAIAMHMQGLPATMQQDPRYQNVGREVRGFLEAALGRAQQAGIRQVMVDPGIGFGKTLAHNLELLGQLATLRALGAPLLLGTSRKGFIGQLTGDAAAARLEGTLASSVLGVAQGVDMVRVHDVLPVVRALKVADAIVRRPHG